MKQIVKCITFMTLFCLVLASCSNGKQTTQQSEEKAAHTEKSQASKDLITDKDKKTIKKELLSWLDEHEKDNHKAVSNRYFGNGSMSDEDWYAGSEDGEIQVSNRDKPGPKAFDLHTVTGAVTYTSHKGTTGIDKDAETLSNIEGYNKVADTNKPVTKYLFADNGKVYEYEFTHSEDVTLSSGFAPKDHNGKDPNLKPNEMFQVSDNKALNDFYQDLLKQYQS